jgi:hypothetical protein
MPKPLDETSKLVATRLKDAQGLLSETERVLKEETTARHRTQWPNVYRLESATRHAQKVLALTDPHITQLTAADELVASATQARDAIRAAVDSGGGDLIGSADRLLNAAARIEPGQLLPGEAETAALRLTEVQEEVETSKERIDQQIDSQDAKFSEEEVKRAERFDDSLHNAEVDLSQARAAFDVRAQEAQEHIAELENEIGQTAAALGGQAIAIDNNKESEEQATKAFRWTVLTVALLILAAGIPLIIGVENSKQSPESVAGKITIGLILAGIASYTAGVARHHRQRAATARRLAIELNAFGPFIAPLEKEDRDDLRSTIVWRFFGPPDAVNQDADAAPTPGPQILQVLSARRKTRKSSAQSSRPEDV